MNDIRNKQINRNQNNRCNRLVWWVDVVSNASHGLISNLEIFSNADSCIVSTPHNIVHYFYPY